MSKKKSHVETSKSGQTSVKPIKPAKPAKLAKPTDQPAPKVSGKSGKPDRTTDKSVRTADKSVQTADESVRTAAPTIATASLSVEAPVPAERTVPPLPAARGTTPSRPPLPRTHALIKMPDPEKDFRNDRLPRPANARHHQQILRERARSPADRTRQAAGMDQGQGASRSSSSSRAAMPPAKGGGDQTHHRGTQPARLPRRSPARPDAERRVAVVLPALRRPAAVSRRNGSF